MEKKVKGLVLRSTQYGDYDKLVTVLTEEGKLFFKARGIRSITSKNAAGCAPFVFSDYRQVGPAELSAWYEKLTKH